jgi:hypothetical protein
MKVLRYFPKASVDLAAVLFFWRSSNHAESPWQKSAMRFSVWDWSYLFPSEYGGWSRRHSINSDQDAARTAGHPAAHGPVARIIMGSPAHGFHGSPLKAGDDKSSKRPAAVKTLTR